MFNSILIANRGEIALRIARTTRKLGITPYFVYESEDKDLPHAKEKNSHQIGSYSGAKEIVELASKLEIEAIHPGYGFIAENPEFVRLTNKAGIEFIGPSYEAMLKLGNKQLMLKSADIADIPHIPGTFLNIKNIDRAIVEANNIGYPVIVKGIESGGGRQIKVLQNDEELKSSIDRLDRTSDIDEIYISKYLTNVKHIEVQILGDKHGDFVSLGTRDCSIQRRFQKLIEEAPSMIPILYQHNIEQSAIEIVNLVDYTNACTVEFLFDQNGKHYFMEVNPRLQVEHCVTEEIYNGLDIVEHQIRIAFGEKLDPSLKELKQNGHAIQCRINAEDPLNDFKPLQEMKLEELVIPKEIPGKIRFESFLTKNLKIPTIYDSLVAKLIIHENTREEAIKETLTQLDKLIINGFPSTISLFKEIFNEKFFCEGNHKTNYINLFMADLVEKLQFH